HDAAQAWGAHAAVGLRHAGAALAAPPDVELLAIPAELGAQRVDRFAGPEPGEDFMAVWCHPRLLRCVVCCRHCTATAADRRARSSRQQAAGSRQQAAKKKSVLSLLPAACCLLEFRANLLALPPRR